MFPVLAGLAVDSRVRGGELYAELARSIASSWSATNLVLACAASTSHGDRRSHLKRPRDGVSAVCYISVRSEVVVDREYGFVTIYTGLTTGARSGRVRALIRSGAVETTSTSRKKSAQLCTHAIGCTVCVRNLLKRQDMCTATSAHVVPIARASMQPAGDTRC